MPSCTQLTLLARYNQWMNDKLYDSAAQLPAAELTRDRGAFFGSILGTLNHIAVADTIWLRRFAGHPACAQALAELGTAPSPTRLDEPLFADLASLRVYRARLDGLILALVDTLPQETLSQSLTYANTKGVRATRSLEGLLMHFFNHQTHHRGQVTTLLFQAGIDPGATDLLLLVPQQDAQS